jgi:hypothetical protein
MASQKIGNYAFLAGIVIALVMGVAGGLGLLQSVGAYIPLVMVVLGLIIGLMNIHDKHISDFLIATIAIILVGGTAAGLLTLNEVVTPLGTICQMIVGYIVALAAPAALVVGLKQIFNLAKDQVA